ncbi:MAG TPA: hypothetical protein VKV57_05085 [bacterium]|nr:hypothetical protein [bacterium]
MSPTIHALVGAAIGRFVRHPGEALLAGIASHSVLDCLPHKDSRHPAVLLLHACGVLGVAAAALTAGDSAALAGAVGGVLPDLENLREKPPHDRIFPGHRFRHDRYPLGPSLGAELLLAAAAVVALAATHPTAAPAPPHRKTLQGVFK